MTIVCVTPNPAIDRTLIVPGWRVGEVQRPERIIVATGGKGLNVARTIGDPLVIRQTHHVEIRPSLLSIDADKSP
jgi:hypothetical protein